MKFKDVQELKTFLVDEIKKREFTYVWYQEALDLNLSRENLDEIAKELDFNIKHAVLTCGFFWKGRRVGSGLEGKRSKDVKKQYKKDLQKPKALN